MIKNLMDKISNKKIIISVVIVLVILELLLIYLAVVSYNNKNLNKYTFGNKDLKNTSLFAVMVEDSKGDYKEQSTFPDFPYQFNITKSSCIDREGNTIKDSMLFDEENREVVLKVNKSTGCYLFFDKPKESFATSLINSEELWQSGLEGDGYRYVGSGNYDSETTPSNYICFGTTDKTECKNNEAKYMYRIIGVFQGSDGEQHLKLISLKQLSSTYAWNASYTTDVAWENSDMYRGLNGSYFLTNTTYDYLQNNTWLNKIEDWIWSAVNTKTWSDSGPDYNNSLSPSQIYLHEMNRSSKTSSIGEWSTPTAKIGLMYASDYTLSLGSSALAITGSTSSNASTLKTGWMHQSNNDTTASTTDWTLSRSGGSSGYFSAWVVYSDGSVDYGSVHDAYGVRPVFHLTSDVEKLSGKGSYNDPYLIKETNENKLKVSTSLSGNTMTSSITKGDYDLNKYCINNSTSIIGCTWNKVTSETITTEVTEGRTYIHVIDKGGYLVHDSVNYRELSFAEKLIASGELWQSGLEGDGYRYTGTGIRCSYDDGNYITNISPEVSTCSTLYNYTRTTISSGATTNFKYTKSCPSDTSTYTYSCTELTGTIIESSKNTVPNNFICFGTTDKTECKNNETKYMYRIIGVFSDSSNNQHVKLINLIQLSNNYKWNANYTSDVAWENSDLYSGLNGSYFLTNTKYDYMQNSTWLNKIENWTWSAVNTLTNESSGLDYSTITPREIYLHEMNRSSKTNTIGEWSTPVAKIGLMYASDYTLSLGSSALSMTGSTYANKETLLTGWLHQSNNYANTSSNEWTISRSGDDSGYYLAWAVRSDGHVDDVDLVSITYVRPVFYLTDDVKYKSGSGSYSDPYIIN